MLNPSNAFVLFCPFFLLCSWPISDVYGLQEFQQLNAQLDFRESNVHLEDGSTDLKEAKRKEKAKVQREHTAERRRKHTGASVTYEETEELFTPPTNNINVPVPKAVGSGVANSMTSRSRILTAPLRSQYGSVATSSNAASAATPSSTGLQFKHDSYSITQEDYTWVDGTDNVLLCLDRTVDSDTVSINENFTVAEGFRLFRQLGLRHLPVCNSGGKLVGKASTVLDLVS
jgi:hypothetical protein